MPTSLPAQTQRQHPPTVKSLSDDDINAVAAYVKQPLANRQRIDARAVTGRAGFAVGGRERFGATASQSPPIRLPRLETSGDGSAGGPTLPRELRGDGDGSHRAEAAFRAIGAAT